MLVVKGKRRNSRRALAANGKKVKGRGLLNFLIEKIPFQAHLPGGWSWCGPGTDVLKNLKNNVVGKNPLDADPIRGCKGHDLIYFKYKDLATRHEADRRLRDFAWERFKAKDSDWAEKAAAYMIINVMKAKLAMGAGVKKQKKKTTKRTKKARQLGGKIAPCGGGFVRKKKTKKRKKKSKKGAGIRKTIKKKTVGKKRGGRVLPVGRVIPLPKKGGILQYLLPPLSGLTNIGSVAGTATELYKTIQNIRGKGLRNPGVLAPFKKGYGLYLKPYEGNFLKFPREP